ncbi:hypothetical protein KP509_12G004600 [Ceratopteris richardii]|uniref:1,3-beta-glucan synthase n=1 Tax=Ceratopteris richardii TaxID=49495 RepID=A0A8T2TP51_CERRI|nr:hypothetical protein KP509_12G004600 [Ceratopteris richardii]
MGPQPAGSIVCGGSSKPRQCAELLGLDGRGRRTEDTFNILPLHNILVDDEIVRFPEVRAVLTALQNVEGLSEPPECAHGKEFKDLLDWLALFFGFQTHNVKNQREHLVMLLANQQMRLQPPPDPLDHLDSTVVEELRKKLLNNYVEWCSFLRKANNLWLQRGSHEQQQRELLYVGLYLLIWGEAANLRFMPECLCFLFHNMAGELNKILEPLRRTTPGRMHFTCRSSIHCTNLSAQRLKPHTMDPALIPPGGIYDDLNEFFWSDQCFTQLSWPMNPSCFFMYCPPSSVNPDRRVGVGKTGFVEQRSFWNLFRSFDHLWIALIIILQTMIILAFHNHEKAPWTLLSERDVQAQTMSIFISWGGMRLLHSLLDMIMQFALISAETILIGVRMLFKIFFASIWTMVFAILYTRAWHQRGVEGDWINEADAAFRRLVIAVVVFILPEMFSIILLVLPWIGNLIEGSEHRVSRALTWWFYTPSYVGRALREGLWDNIKSALFWIIVLAAKFCFSYFLQIRPLVVPTRELLALRDVEYSWYEFWGSGSNRVAVFVLWAPVVLVYFMDLQIWYTILSALVGYVIGLLQHIGEIRNFDQVKMRFQFFASAASLNLRPEESLFKSDENWGSWLRKSIRRITLRHGFSADYKEYASGCNEVERFALLWNTIIKTLREEDIISDKEVRLLEVPPPAWNISVIQILREGSEESQLIERIFSHIQNSLNVGSFLKDYKVKSLRRVRDLIMELVKVLKNRKSKYDKRFNKVENIFRSLCEVVGLHLMRSDSQQIGEESTHRRMTELPFTKAIVLPDPHDAAFRRQLLRFYTILKTERTMHEIPRSREARRRIVFFCNSLFMNMPNAPPVDRMLGFSVLTPYFEEEVLYSKDYLEQKTDDGISVLFYLRTIFRDDWSNFKRRMKREKGLEKVRIKNLWNIDGGIDLRLWASYRGQTLARTVRGMMYYHKALKMLAYLDSASSIELQEGRELLAAVNLERNHVVHRGLYNEAQQNAVANIKFTYVVTCQLYGEYNVATNPEKKRLAEDIQYLMRNNNALRIAYVDKEVKPDGSEVFSSVLVKYDALLGSDVVIYRIQLPGPIKLGEGKPENQNHALIFTRGDALQTIDMNQDNYFEEALKARNLLQEFTVRHGLRKPQILGVREHVFTGTVSSVASFMSGQETSFVTLGQRVLANPLKVRMHYGHPDVFDRLWFLQRGGISKASSKINVSEDIYAGFNCTLRGGNVTHHEYIQAGKGRDLGLSQIAVFESKVASGNGEQVLSRDVYRLAHRLDFFRMLSFYYTTVGFFISNLMVVITVYAFLWGRVYLALSGLENSVVSQSAFANTALTASLNQQFLVQLGILTALPMILENSLEHGCQSALWDFIIMQLQLASVFFTFSLGTRAHYFGRTILHTGAGYRATGRGFVLRHEKFCQTYILFSRSHFVKGLELIVLLVIYQVFGAAGTVSTTAYLLITISTWFLAFSWILGPFLFNALGFDQLKLSQDFDEFWDWIWDRRELQRHKDAKNKKAEDEDENKKAEDEDDEETEDEDDDEDEDEDDDTETNPERSWKAWWSKEYEHLNHTSFWGMIFEIVLNLRFLFLQYGIVYHLNIVGGHKSILVYVVSWVYMAVLAAIYMILLIAARKFSLKQHLYYRLVQAIIVVLMLIVLIVLATKTSFQFFDTVLSVFAFLPTGWALLSIALVFRRFIERTPFWEIVISVARLYELFLGILVFIPLLVLSWIPGFQGMQSRILFSTAYVNKINIARLLQAKQPKKQSGYNRLHKI